MNVLVCSNCDHQMGNYNHSEWGIICDDCFIEYKFVEQMDMENESKRDIIANGGEPGLTGF